MSLVTNHARALDYIGALRRGQAVVVDWVSPAVATMLAAERVRRAHGLEVSFAANCKTYAEHIGLDHALAGDTQLPERSPRKGTYSPLARLATHSDVDRALDIVTPVLHTHLAAEHASTINEVCRIIGELHDNVASHARGAGFSALQVYSSGDGSRIALAVADAGVGLLANVRSFDPTVQTHHAAIHWCLQKGNTTARSAADGFEQRLPDDAIRSPFPPGVPTRATENNHLGEGLWQLLQLVMELNGALWLLTGDAELSVSPDIPQGRYGRAAVDWPGVAIEVILPVEKTFVSPPGDQDESIARRFGI